MLVCHCHALTDRDIRRTIRATGACNVAEVGDHCGAATGCGGCYEAVDEIVSCEKRRLVMYQSEGHEANRPGHEANRPGLEQATLQAPLALTG